MRPILLFLTSLGAFAANSSFDGRWDIRVQNEPRNRAWWLEVQGTKGRFVGFPGGDMDAVQNIAVENGVLKFRMERGKERREYEARLVNGKLEGVVKAGSREWKWEGVRAAEIKEKDDKSWKEGKPIDLFNKKDLSGWHGIIAGQKLGWTVEDGVLKSTGGANNLESDQKFWNFKLHVEFKVGQHSNSGVGLRGRYEVQILEDYGQPADTHSSGALYSRVAPKANVSKPAGEWQVYDIRLVGRHLTVVYNGQQVVKTVIEGLTAIATDPNEGTPGPITLQGDHGPVEFRSVVLTPLVKK
jgi:hypothetical protein